MTDEGLRMGAVSMRQGLPPSTSPLPDRALRAVLDEDARLLLVDLRGWDAFFIRSEGQKREGQF